MDIWITGLTAPVALAAVALLGYLSARQQRRLQVEITGARRKMHQANSVIHQLEAISQQLRRNLAEHHSTVSRCHQQIRELGQAGQFMNIHDQVEDIRQMLAPTERLSREIAAAYHELRRHSDTLKHLKAE
jgi:predicted  nucleic acid-binding Zn-ribbon protein